MKRPLFLDDPCPYCGARPRERCHLANNRVSAFPRFFLTQSHYEREPRVYVRGMTSEQATLQAFTNIVVGGYG